MGGFGTGEGGKGRLWRRRDEVKETLMERKEG